MHQVDSTYIGRRYHDLAQKDSGDEDLAKSVSYVYSDSLLFCCRCVAVGLKSAYASNQPAGCIECRLLSFVVALPPRSTASLHTATNFVIF